MKQLKFLIIVCLLFLSCNDSTNTSSTSLTDDHFLGTWVYLDQVPATTQNDNTMAGQTCKITKIESTNESYKVDILGYHEILFAKTNDSTLKAIANNMEIKYKESNQHIIYLFNANSGMEFYRLK